MAPVTRRKGKNAEPPGQTDDLDDLFLKDARSAVEWLEQNEVLFSDAVSRPSILNYSSEEAKEAIEEFRNSWSKEAMEVTAEPLCFVFQNADDMEIFMAEVRDGLGLKVQAAVISDLQHPISPELEIVPDVQEEVAGIESDGSLKIAPTAAATITKLRKTIRNIKNKTLLLQKEVELLKGERDFLRDNIVNALAVQPTTSMDNQTPGAIVQRKEKPTNPDSDTSSDLGSSSESTDSSEQKLTKRSKKKRKKGRQESRKEFGRGDLGSSSESSDPFEQKLAKRVKKHRSRDGCQQKFGRRVMTPDEVTNRYKVVLKEYRKSLSLTMACKRVNVSKETMKLSAIIAEVNIVVNRDSVPIFKEGEALSKYAKRCKAFLDKNPAIMEEMTEMRKKKELLPLKFKFSKH